MEKKLYEEMLISLNEIGKTIDLTDKKIFLFGHCNATFELIDLLQSKNLKAIAILDNSEEKQGQEYKGAIVVYPGQINELTGCNSKDDSIVLITSRFYESMLRQLRELGYGGSVRKIIDYNTYAEYSLAADTIARMTDREKHGEELLSELSDKYANVFKVFFPFNALGDVYLAMSYWLPFALKMGIGDVVFCCASKALADIIHLFDDYSVEVYSQKELDAMIQAVIYTQDKSSFVAHHDRPYVVNLHKALYLKIIPLEQIYCCGVYGLPQDTRPQVPCCDMEYKRLDDIPEGEAVIFSPYAKSIPSLDCKILDDAVRYYSSIGYKCFTNVVGEEAPLEGTQAISPSILELKSVVERAGTFVGIRSGLCDVIRDVKAKKIALYPDYNYCDTKWKAIEMYWIDQFDHNLLATEEIKWETL